MSQYQELAGQNIRYDRSQKRYFATDSFKPRFMNPDADRYLMHLQSIGDGILAPEEGWIMQAPTFATLPLPRRNVEPAIFKAILQTVRAGRALEIRYQSLSVNRPQARLALDHAARLCL